ncbi:MAG: hypothetical protein AB8H03_00680 [Saprospiraceae bacterium]
MKYHNNTFTIFIFLLFTHFLSAQVFIGDFDFNDKNQTHLLILNNGEVKYGKIISIQDTQLTFLEDEKTDTILFELSELDKILVDSRELDMSFPDHQEFFQNDEQKKHDSKPQIVKGNNRLFYAETGFTLYKREKEFNSILGLIHTFDYGMNDAVTFGFGFSNFGHIIFHTKFNYIHGHDSSKFRAGFDIQAVGKPERTFNQFENREMLGWTGFVNAAAYFSYGTPDRNVYLALNFAPIFEPFEFFDEILVKFSFGGTVRIGRHWKLIYENSFGALETRNNSIFGVFSGFGASWFNDKNVVKFGIQSSTAFGVFNFPIDEFNQNSTLLFVSYSRYF